MWIFLNDAFFSIVEDREKEEALVVRARFKGDIERVFEVDDDQVIESENSDYRFRVWLPRETVAKIIHDEITHYLKYDNFKNSVDEEWRAKEYTKVWTVLYNAQELKYPRRQGWWLNYDKYYYHNSSLIEDETE